MTMPTTVLRFQLAKRATRRPGPDETEDANLRPTSWASKRMEAAGPWDRAGKTCSRRRQRKTVVVAGLEAPQQSPALRAHILESYHPSTGHLSSTKTSGTGVNNLEPAQCPGAALLREMLLSPPSPQCMRRFLTPAVLRNSNKWMNC